MSTPLLPLLRAYAAERRRTLTEHPTPDELVDYHLGDGTPEQRERLQDHLALCPDCARAVLDLAAFPAVAPAAGGEGSLDTTAAWNRLRDRAFAVAPVIPHPSSTPRQAWSVSLIAASLLMATLSGAGGFLMGKFGSPQSGEPSAAFVQGATERSGGMDDVQEIYVRASAAPFFLFLLPEDSQEFSTYDAELTHLGNPVLIRTGLHSDSEGWVGLNVPRDLPSGIYTVRLYEVGKGRERTPTPVLEEKVDLEWQGRRD